MQPPSLVTPDSAPAPDPDSMPPVDWTEGERRLLDLFELAGEMILILDPIGRVLFANEAWRSSLGYPASESAGLTVFDVTRRVDHAVCESWLSQSVRESIGSRIRFSFTARDGREVPVEGFTNVRRKEGQVVFLSGLFRDLSQERRAEAAQRESAELFHLLTNHTPLGVFRMDSAGRVTYASNRWKQIAGLSHVAQPRGVWWQIVHVADRDRLLADWTSSLRHALEFSSEFRIQGTFPAERWCRIRISLTCGSDGAVQGGFGTTEDITEHRQAAHALRRAHDDLEERVRTRTAELEAANHELAEFAYVVSHDLKAPLRGVSLLSEWLAQDYAGSLGPEGVELFEKLRTRVRDMHSLVDGVLSYMRIGRTAEDEVEVALGPLLKNVIETVAPPPEILFDVQPSLPSVRGLPQQLGQVFQNLIDNAVKFIGRPDGRVAVGARREEGQWEFFVADNGPGIHPRHHARIFQIFQRLDPGSGTPGSGIGLSLVKRIVETRGGRITVESVEGLGTTFRFTWPDEPAPTRREGRSTEAAATRTPRPWNFGQEQRVGEKPLQSHTPP
ncbi:MAG: PAS domain-containing sensor histidine kinase [Verrucomicrobiales bacterium]|nr:PAS domain-containing sensor histidine kinase [Verrucomicrobiales bacterium]